MFKIGWIEIERKIHVYGCNVYHFVFNWGNFCEKWMSKHWLNNNYLETAKHVLEIDTRILAIYSSKDTDTFLKFKYVSFLSGQCLTSAKKQINKCYCTTIEWDYKIDLEYMVTIDNWKKFGCHKLVIYLSFKVS